MKKYKCDMWNYILTLPEGPDKEHQLQMIGELATRNLYTFVMRLLHKNRVYMRHLGIWRVLK